MKEAVFCTEVINSFRAQNHWAYKIPDVPKVKGLRFNHTRPFDVVAFVNRHALAIECKQLKKWGSFSGRLIRDCQKQALNEIVLSQSGKGFIFLNVRIQRTSRLYILDWDEWGYFLTNNGLIKKEQLQSMPCVVAKKGLFDIAHWCNTFD